MKKLTKKNISFNAVEVFKDCNCYCDCADYDGIDDTQTSGATGLTLKHKNKNK